MGITSPSVFFLVFSLTESLADFSWYSPEAARYIVQIKERLSFHTAEPSPSSGTAFVMATLGPRVQKTYTLSFGAGSSEALGDNSGVQGEQALQLHTVSNTSEHRSETQTFGLQGHRISS